MTERALCYFSGPSMTDNVPCRFFQQGRCNAGRQCKFSHNPAVLKTQPQKAPCRFFQQGACAAGDACQYSHVLIKKDKPQVSRTGAAALVPKPIGGIALPSKHALKSGAVVGPVSDRLFGGEDTKYETETFTIGGGEEHGPAGAAASGPGYAAVLGHGVQPSYVDPAAFGFATDAGPVSEEELQKRKELRERMAKSEGEECGICMEQVKQKGTQFGLLDGCNHVFCVECIREWRQVGQLDKSVKRSCPLCRCESHFVIPSSYVPSTEEEKYEVVQTYHARLKKIPCRHFDQGRGECPFGTRCVCVV